MAKYASSRIITTAVLAITLGAPAQPTKAAAELPAPTFVTERDAEAYEWMQSLFAAAGLEQPTATIEFFDNDESCNGAPGQTAYAENGPATSIIVCVTHANPEVQEQWRRRTLLREVPHAWIYENASAGNIGAFTELRGLETWSSVDVKWEERATEHAAEIFMWGIQGGDYNVDSRIDGTTCGELAAGYQLLTGLNQGCDAISIGGSTPQQKENAEWALSRFDTAGLDLPPLSIVFHHDYESCGMREGVLRITGDAYVVHECERDPARSKRSLLHELAHVWDYSGRLDDSVRSDFLRLRGLAAWSDSELPWNQRGEEQAAEIIAWGLMHRPAPIPTSVGNYGEQDPAELAAAFTLLTGVPLLFENPKSSV